MEHKRDWHVASEWKCNTCGTKQPARLAVNWARCTYCGSPDVAPVRAANDQREGKS